MDHAVTISGWILEPEVQKRLIAHLRGTRAPKADPGADDLRPLREELSALRASLVRLATAYAEGQMDSDEYQGAREKLREKQKRLERDQEKRATKMQTRMAREAAAALREDLGRITVPMIVGLSPEERRELYELFIERVIVNPVGQGDRATVVFRY